MIFNKLLVLNNYFIVTNKANYYFLLFHRLFTVFKKCFKHF